MCRCEVHLLTILFEHSPVPCDVLKFQNMSVYAESLLEYTRILEIIKNDLTLSLMKLFETI